MMPWILKILGALNVVLGVATIFAGVHAANVWIIITGVLTAGAFGGGLIYMGRKAGLQQAKK